MDTITLTKTETQFSLKGAEKLILRVWKNRIHAPIHPDNTMGIYIRIDHFNKYSAPFEKEYYFPDTEKLDKKTRKVCDDLLEFYEFPAPVEQEERIIALLSKLKVTRRTKEW